MPQLPCFKIAGAAPRIDEFAVGAAGHRVDRQVAPLEILFNRDGGRRIEREAGVAWADFPLRTRECVLLAGLRVNENGEIFTHLTVAECEHLTRRRADDEPVPLADRPSEQRITDRAADLIYIHDRTIIPQGSFMLRWHSMRWPGLLMVAAVCAVMQGCAMPFYWQAIGGQLELLRKRTPIEKVLADPDGDERVKATLSRVPEIRQFAIDELALPNSKSYQTYVDLGRPYVVWNVIATDEFSVNPKRWCYPFTGCVAYRGFFNRKGAERFRDRLERQGLDTYIGGASAYSTLGYFADPILSTMVIGGEQYVGADIAAQDTGGAVLVHDRVDALHPGYWEVRGYDVDAWVGSSNGRDDEPISA